MEFSERQRFTQFWIWLILLAINGMVIWAVIRQIGYGIPVGNKPAGDTGLAFIFLVVNLVTFFFIFLSLRTRVDDSGIHVRFFPFHRKEKTITWGEINKAYIREYRPISEYGGWGLRVWGGSGAYNVSGKIGLQLELKNGKKILIGTQRPEDLEAAVRNYLS